MSGQHAGLVTMSDASGRFSFDQDVASPSTVRATKEGYAVGTRTSVFLTDGRAYVSFSLASINPPVAVAGSYTLTITADSTCAALPDDVRTRTYPATVGVATSSTAPANTRFDGKVTGGQFAPFLNLFWVGVFGDYVNISTEGEGPSIAEHLGGNRYVAFYGSGAASVGTASSRRSRCPSPARSSTASSPRRSARITTAARPRAPCATSAGRPAIS